MANARAAQLANQRSQYSAYRLFSERRAVSPAGSLASQASSIARQAAEAELDSKTSQYNAGLISNDEMLGYLKSLQTNNVLSLREKADISNKIRDFDDRIRLEKLTAVYNNTQKGTVERINAAQAIQSYYQQKAANTVPDTPAHSNALQMAGDWTNAVTNETDSMNRTARQLKRAVLFRQVANEQPNTEEELMMKAQAYVELANQARDDGDETEALRYETQAQNTVDQIPLLAERQEKTAAVAERKDIVDTINTIANAYHDGKITAQQFAEAIPELEGRVIAIGDTSLQLALNKWADTLAKDVQKGVKRGEFQGLPVVLGKGGAGGGSGTQTNWDKEDYDYSDNIRLAKAMFDKGKWDANKYMQIVGKALTERALQMEKRIATIEAIAEENPNAKVVYEGKKQRAADVLERLYEAQENFSPQVDAYNSGNFALAEVAPNQFLKSGDVRKTGKSQATYELIDLRNLPKDQYVKDSDGVYHQILREQMKLTKEQAAQAALMGGYYTDDSGNVVGRVQYDDSGNAYVLTDKQYVDIYEPGTANKKSIPFENVNQKLPGWNQILSEHKQILMNQLKKAQKLKQQENQKNMLQETQKNQTQQTLQKQAVQPTVIKKAQEVISKAVPVQQPAKIDTAAAQAAPAAKVVAPVMPVIKSAEQLQIPQNVKISLPATPMPQQNQSVIKMPVAEPLKIAATTGQNALQKQAQQPGFKPVSIPAPNVPSNIAKIAEANRNKDYSVTGSLKALYNNVKNLASRIWPF